MLVHLLLFDSYNNGRLGFLEGLNVLDLLPGQVLLEIELHLVDTDLGL